MKKIIINSFSIIAMLFCILTISCSSDNFDKNGLQTDVDVSITSFKVNGLDATIDQKTKQITLTLPYGSTVTKAVPEIIVPKGATTNPTLGTAIDFTNPVYIRVTNGNLYKDYVVNVVVLDPILSFKINNVEAIINNTNKTIMMTLPDGTNLTSLTPEIKLSTGVSISPSSGVATNFSSPVIYTITSGSVSAQYTATIITPVTGISIAFLGTANSRQGITNLDEKTACDWLFNNFSNVTYISFDEISGGASLSNFNVIWWHHDAAIALPTIALSNNVINALKGYRSSGGNLLLTSFASQYVDALGIVPAGKGPNNVWGDFLPAGWVDANSWGMSFKGNENHPIFQNLETFEPGKAKLLEKGTYRLNHTAWWFIPDWGGYVNGAGWRTQTGGNNLASEDWDDALNGRVTISEFPRGASNINVIEISMGAYDWYNETNSNGNPSQANGFLGNIKQLTKNSIKYLADH